MSFRDDPEVGSHYLGRSSQPFSREMAYSRYLLFMQHTHSGVVVHIGFLVRERSGVECLQ